MHPFTSLEAAQSSSIMSVLVPSKYQLTTFKQIFHLVLLASYHRHSWVNFINSEVGLVLRECRADKHGVVELAAERAVDLVYHKPRFA